MTAALPTLAKMKSNPSWASLPLFDRKGWKRMAFGEFAESIGERAEPKDAQEEIYVGLEHLDPQCLHIRRWGKGSDVIGGKLRFRNGDIIFGKRRAYQRKLAVAEFRRKMIGSVLGPKLFYNSPMEACVVVCRTQKPKTRRGKILFINAVNEVTRERAQSFLTDEHLQRVVRASQDFKDEPGFTRVVPIEEIRAKEGNLSIPLYVGGETQAKTNAATETASTALPDALTEWFKSSQQVRKSLAALGI